MDKIVDYLFGSAAYLPHGYCLLWQPSLVAVHVVSDVAIAASYFFIPLGLAYFTFKRKSFNGRSIFYLFIAFIFACGVTHVMNIATLWYPIYGAQGVAKAMTGIISAVTAVALVPIIPRLISMPSRKDLEESNAELARSLQEKEQLLIDLERTRDELKHNKLFLEAVLNNVSDGIVACDAEGRLSIFNRAAAEIHEKPGNSNVTPQDWPREYGLYQADGETLETVETLPLAAALRGEVIRGREGVIRNESGGRAHTINNAQPMYDDRGRKIGAVCTFHDITEERRAQEQMVRAQKLEAMGQLTGGIAHDFNNLLATIQASMQLLARKVTDQELVEKYINASLRAIRNGKELTRSLLSFSRQDEAQRELMDPARTIEEITPLFTRLIEASVTLDLDLTEDLTVLCDPSQFENSVLNLIVNARDALEGRADPRITVRLYRTLVSRPSEHLPEGEYAVLEVTDNGCGMTEDVMKLAFDPFFTTKERGRGTGLGLAMVYGFARRSDGDASIESTVGEGTRVKVYLPLRRAAESLPRPEEDEAGDGARPLGSGEVVLVVEDQPDLLEATSHLLEDLGYEVICAENGRTALEVLEANPQVELVLTDIIMPGGLSGFELADEARRMNPELRFIYTTGYPGRFESEARANHLQLLQKPFSEEKLARLLAQNLSTRVE